jgi:hypothetical protein
VSSIPMTRLSSEEFDRLIEVASEAVCDDTTIEYYDEDRLFAIEYDDDTYFPTLPGVYMYLYSRIG